jgi:hypothetical protein
MVRFNVIILLFVSIGLFGQNQVSETDFDEVIWFGLDYSLVKFIGASEDFSDLEKIQNYYFRTWNELILEESSKYNLKRAFKVKKVEYAMDSAIARSERRDMQDIVQTDEYRLTGDLGPEIAKAYSNPEINKVGAVFMMETLNKPAVEETMWVVLFHVSTGQVFHTERLVGLPKGFGFRNFWAGGYYSALEEGVNRPQ